MFWGPIANRELLIAARRLSTYINRVVVMGIVFLLAFLALWSSEPESGRDMFLFLSWIAFFFSLSIGSVFTAESFVRERAQNTLGLLFLTDLSSSEILLGKWMSGWIQGFSFLLIFFSGIILSFLKGGILIQQVLLEIFLLLGTMFFSLSVGIWMSTWTSWKTPVHASGGCFAFLMLGNILYFLFWFLMKERLGESLPEFTAALSPLFGQIWITQSFSASSPATFFGRIFLSGFLAFLLGILFLVYGSKLLRKNWQVGLRSKQKADLLDLKKMIFKIPRLPTSRSPIFQKDPILWLETIFHLRVLWIERRALFWLMCSVWFLLGEAIFWGLFSFGTSFLEMCYIWWVFDSICLVYMINKAGEGLPRFRHSKMEELLFSVPEGKAQWLNGRYKAFWLASLPVTLMVGTGYLTLLICGIIYDFHHLTLAIEMAVLCPLKVNSIFLEVLTCFYKGKKRPDMIAFALASLLPSLILIFESEYQYILIPSLLYLWIVNCGFSYLISKIFHVSFGFYRWKSKI